MKRGEVWWANLPPPAGGRPVLLLARDKAYEIRTAVTVAEITSTIRSIPVEVLLGKNDGMDRDCVVNLDTIMTIPKQLLVERITVLGGHKMALVNQAIRFALGLPEP
jgi:mRNA interferase MazF